MRALAAATALFLLSATAAPAIPSMTSAPAISATGAPGAAANAATGKNDPGAQLDEPLPNAVDFKQSSDAQTLLSKASVAIGRFRSDDKITGLMRQAKGVFVIPEFGHATQVPGGHWGAGVLLVNGNGHWSDPAFYSLGGGSLGQTIANGGSLILYIMNDRAMAKFRAGTTWSLNPQAGLNLVMYSKATPQDLSGSGADIVAWSAAGGPNSDTQVSIVDMSLDTASNQAVYGTTDMRNILANRTPYLSPAVINLTRSMPSVPATGIAQNHPPPGRG